MPGLADKITSVATGDAYKKPAKTEAGAFTTEDSKDAHTTEGTTSDPKVQQKMADAENKAKEAASEEESQKK